MSMFVALVFVHDTEVSWMSRRAINAVLWWWARVTQRARAVPYGV